MHAAERILILDYGSQFTQLIARKVRELGVYCEIFPHDAPPDALRAFAPHGVILSGGPESTLDANAPSLQDAVLQLAVPVLGLCYGMQLLTRAGGGAVEAGGGREYGAAQISLMTGAGAAQCPLFAGIDARELQVWMSHGDHIRAPARGDAVVAQSADGIIAAVENAAQRRYGLQFHPEVAHTQGGVQMLKNFVRGICALHGTWTMPNFIPEAVAETRAQVGRQHILLALSGGVDSAVVAALLHRAVGAQLHCVLVDNGLLRHGEAESVREVFQRQFGMELTVVDAAPQFFAALAGVEEPEEKRRRIGHTFIEVLEAQAAALGDRVQWLAQGTIYPDVVESAKTGAAKATIKTHHNVGGLPERLKLQLIEPLRDLFKDEVRRLGEALGLAHDLMWRHPFPGPGLAVRVLGEVTPARVDTVRRADRIFLQELTAAGAYGETAQAFAVLLPVHSVGVMGDARTYENVVALRAVVTDDFMTADWARLDASLLARASGRIINEVPGVNRVVYDISSKPPATVEWE